MEFNQMIAMASKKMEEGIKKYGEFDPKKDDRNFKKEILDELLDAFNYANMGLQKNYGNKKKRIEFFNLARDIMHLISNNF